MKYFFLSILFVAFFSANSYGQKNDTTGAANYELKADQLFSKYKFDSAAHYYHQAALIYEMSKSWLKSVRNYRLTANSFVESSNTNIDTAKVYLKKAKFIADKYFKKDGKKESFEFGEISFVEGLINYKLGKYEFAIENYEKALNHLLLLELEKQRVAKTWYEIAKCYVLSGKYDRALIFSEKSLKMRIEELGNNHIDVASSMEMFGVIYKNTGKYEEALKLHINSLEIRKKSIEKHPKTVAASYLNIGNIYNLKGDFEKSNKYYLEALRIQLRIFGETHHHVAMNYNNIGFSYNELGDYEKGLEYFKKALSISLKAYGENHFYTGLFYANIGDAYRQIGKFEKSIEYNQKAMQIYLQVFGKKHDRIANIYETYGTIYLNSGDLNKAIDSYKNALNIYWQTVGVDNLYIGLCFIGLGNVFKEKGNFSEAYDYYSKAIDKIYHAFGEKHPYRAQVYNDIAYIFSAKGKLNKSLDFYQKALISNLVDFNDSLIYNNPKTLNALSKPNLVKTLSEKAKAFNNLFIRDRNINDIENSIKTYDLVFDLINEIRNDYSHESTKLLLSENTKVYLTGALFAINNYFENVEDSTKYDKVFTYLEKSKSATLSGFFKNLRISLHNNVPYSFIQKEKNITINRRFYETIIQKNKAKRDGYDTSIVQNYQDILFDFSRQYDTLINTLKSKYPEYYQLKYEQKVASLDDIHNNLNENAALLNYFLADTTLFIAVVTKDSVVYKMINTDSFFNQNIIDYHIDIKSVFTEEEIESSNYLYSYLIKPIEGLIKNKKELVIIPDGNLYYIPFETLGKSSKIPNDYLIKKYTVSYHHSATLWLNSRKREQNIKSDNFIGFAPVFDPKVNNGYMLSSEWVSDTTNVELATRSISSDLRYFNTLPYSEKEIKSIIKLFNKNGGKAEGYFHKNANEESFKDKTKDYKYVHVASHSFTNDQFPALSGIAFSQPDTTAQNDEDGILYAGESYNLNLSNADLVVLSSCKSGLGKLIKGEGFLSLSRGFLYSGVPNIVFSLWNVKDEPTKDLMVHFYKQILNGKSYPEALREAKLKLIGNKNTSEPKYWAAWVLVGK